MTAHDHSTRVPGCFRCDLTGDEMGMTDNETVERLARDAFECFVESFNGDEAGDIDHVGAVNGDSGFAMTGGNDVWAVMLKATQALLPTVRELLAGAWDAGWEVAMHEQSGDYDLAAVAVPTNPYLETGADDE